ncbi:hypothetical protein [Sphingomonas sp. S-NIH.Pt1_0416]|nr:hypothetical protein [Sphingomonas sp. S-NIH.Pt1_0416]
MNVNRKTSFQILLDEWRLLNFYGRFEQVGGTSRFVARTAVS